MTGRHCTPARGIVVVPLCVAALLGCGGDGREPPPSTAAPEWSASEWRRLLRASARDLDTLLPALAQLSTAPISRSDSLRLRRIGTDLQGIERSIPRVPWGEAWAAENEERWRYEDAVHNLRWGVELMAHSLREGAPRLAEYGRYHLRRGLRQLATTGATGATGAVSGVPLSAADAARP